MAADPEVHACLVKRVWAWALSHGDPVRDQVDVPDSVVAELVAEFQDNGLHLNPIIRAVFLHDDFVRF
jgi:hypothetical protein